MAIQWPLTGIITSPYGDKKNRSSPHTGTDIRGATGSMIRAGAAGRVHLIGDWVGSPNAGKVVTIIYPTKAGDLYVIYCHTDGNYKVKKGDVVRVGTDLVAVGTTGTSKGGHAHIEAFLNGKRVNPEDYLSGTVPAAGDITPIPNPKPKTEDDDMDFGYFTRVNPTTKKDEWALTHPLIFPDGVFITGDITLANGFAPYTRVSAALTDDRWAGMIKTAKLVYDAAWAAEARRAALTPSGGSSMGGLTAAEIAKAVNDDAAARLAK